MKVTEKWLPIRGYEGLYEVSDKGNVRSIDRKVICRNGTIKLIKGKIRKICQYPNGYCFVTVSKGSIIKGKLVHRLVMEAFKESSELEVNHKDGDKMNNKLENLEYVTHSENQEHSYRVLNNPPVCSWKGKRGFLHNKSIHIKIHDITSGISKIFGSCRLASENGFNRTAIRKYINTGNLYKGKFQITTL